MKLLKTVLMCVCAVVASCILLAGCGNNSANKADTLTLAFNVDPAGDMNPHTYLPNQFITIDMVYQGLVYYGEGGKIMPQLATSWTVSPDGKTYTFQLRKDVKFSDGEPFTSENVVRNFKTIFSEKNRKMHTWFGLTNEIESFSAPDKYTFVLKLKHPYTATLYDLAMIRPIRFVGDNGFPENGDTATGLKAPVGTGPWMLKDHKKGEYATFVPNPYYWGKKPAAKEVTIKVIPDQQTLALQFESGDIDIIYGNSLIALDQFKKYRSEPDKYVTEVSQPMSTRMLMFNTKSPVLSDLTVRKALEHAVNKQEISEHIFAGIEKPANTMFAPNVPHTDVHIQPYAYSATEAAKLLDEAGWKMGTDGYRVKDGKVLELSFPYIGSNSADKQIAEYIQGEWKKLGIKVNLRAMEEKQYWEDAQKGMFDVMFEFTWGAPWDPHAYLSAMTTTAEGGGPVNVALQGVPMLDQLKDQIHALLIETNPEALNNEYKYVLTTLHDQAVFVPLTYQALEMVYRKGEVKGASFLPEENRLPVFDAVRVK